MKDVLINAKIKSADLVIEYHGIFTFIIEICYDGIYRVVGNMLCRNDLRDILKGIMDVVEVDNWSDLENRYIRFVDVEPGRPIKIIGNIVDNKFIDLSNIEKGVFRLEE